MLRKSSQCDEGKNIHNSGFNCENPKKIIENSENNVPSISYVRNNLLFNCIFVNNVGIKLQFFSDSHRDRCKSPVNQPTRSLYISRKQVLIYKKLAFDSSTRESSKLAVINQTSSLTSNKFKFNFNLNHNFSSSITLDNNNSHIHKETLNVTQIHYYITDTLFLSICFNFHQQPLESFDGVPEDVADAIEFGQGWFSQPKRHNPLHTLVDARVTKEDQENVTENVTEETQITIKYNHLKFNLSVVSVAKAWSCLSNPSIITSKVCQPISRPFLWLLRLSFIQPEPRLRLNRVSRGINILPARVANNLIFNLISNKSFNISSQRMVLFNALHTENLLNGNTFKTGESFIVSVQITRYTGLWWMLVILQSGDIELNPGPISFTLITQNCRGLKKEDKLRQLLHRTYTSHKRENLIMALQETHIESNNLKYIWKGQHIFTEGCGSKGGIITLLSDNIVVLEQVSINNEAQVSVVQVLDSKAKFELIVANIHSPCAHNQEKIDFFNMIKTEIVALQAKYLDAKVVLLGDFNTTFNDGERQGTTRTKSESLVANKITSILNDLDLFDCWEKNGHNEMTWRHGDKMSRLDRIKWSTSLEYATYEIATDWSYTQSDHSAVIVKIKDNQSRRFDKVVRIDTFFMSNVILKHKFLTELDTRMSQVSETTMNPHQKLEYLKMTIRSLAIEISTNYKKDRDKESNDLRESIRFWQNAFESAANESFRSLAMSKLDEMTCKRDKLLDAFGEYISIRLKSKWYQEGEKGTKYFLNMQRSKGNKLEMVKLESDDKVIVTPDEIDQKVENYYKSLYEKGDSKKVNHSNLTNFLKHMENLEQVDIDMVNQNLTLNDLFTTLKTCTDSSPGPDGIPYSLIRLTWKFFGPLLLDSWNYSLNTGSLSHSHEQSYLKLLPKEGKNLLQLKNWRPITLSNCDIKIITKTLAIKVSNALSKIISPNQTAYIKNRQITDNLNLIQYATEKSAELDISTMIVSLDAEKAFDSVEHWYLKEVLSKIGLTDFIAVFDLLYKNQIVNIHLNGRIAGNYKIKNGVKQGDALSCILFVLGIEPLIRNINTDAEVKGIKIHDFPIPKTIAYADDVACIINPDKDNLQKIFDHYQEMSSVSGLNLNADKTEIIINGNVDESVYNMKYNGKSFNITPCEDMKVNGLQIGFDIEIVRQKNFQKVYAAVEKQLRHWSKRHLTLLGKIQIYKTFGLSQILFVSTTLTFTKSENMQLSNLIYKFIWNSDFDKKKAPDRIKRSILNSDIKNLGFGMVDYQDIVQSIRIKTALRLLNDSQHPIGNILRKNINCSLINISVIGNIRPSIDQAIISIKKIWKQSIKTCPPDRYTELLPVVLNEYIGNLLYPRFQNKRMSLYHRHDKLGEIIASNRNHPILKKIDKDIQFLLSNTTTTPNFNPTILNYKQIPVDYKLKEVTKLTTKSIRQIISPKYTVTAKLIINPEPDILAHLGLQIKKLTNIKLKGILLRAIHGDIYSGTRLKKFGMSETDACPRCLSPETIAHQLLECSYTKKIWEITSKITSIPINSINDILGHNPLHDKTTLTIHAEIIRLLMAIDRPTLDQLKMIKSVTKRLGLVERGITKFQISQSLDILNKLT